jgi:hypothetical protein
VIENRLHTEQHGQRPSHFWIFFNLSAPMMIKTWSTLPNMMRILPGRNRASFLRVGKAGGTSNASYRSWPERKQTPDDIAHRMMRIEERGRRMQLTLSKRVESLTRNQPEKHVLKQKRCGESDA